MKKWIEGRVVGNHRWTDRLVSLKVEAPDVTFVAGQFGRLALPAPPGSKEEMIGRPYSFVNSPQSSPHEFYFITLPDGPLSPRLAALAPGEPVWMLPQAWQRFGRIVLVHAVRFAQELTYRDIVGGIGAAHPGAFTSVEIVSREPHPVALSGRIPDAIRDGRLEARAGIALSAENSQVMLCGNPAMVDDTQKTLAARGMRRHRRREPGQITVETYW